jgi:hypothetical protein
VGDDGHFLVTAGVVKRRGDSKAVDLIVDKVHDPGARGWLTAGQFVKEIWIELDGDHRFEGLRGGAFEALIATVLLRCGIRPFYTQAQISFVPNVRFDFLIWTQQRGPIVLSAKTSLRERYKQADLEALALSAVHRRSETYLLTLHAEEARNLKKKITSGEVQALTGVILADSDEMDDLMSYLQSHQIGEAPIVPVLREGRLIC